MTLGVGDWEDFFFSGVGGVSGVGDMVPFGSRGSSPLVFVGKIGGTTSLGILTFINLCM